MTPPLKAPAAAAFLGLHEQTLLERARAGKVPLASKPGKCWIFPEEGLVAYRNLHSPCPYTAADASGGSSSQQPPVDLESLLGLPTRGRRRSITRNARRNSGGRNASASRLR